MDKKVLFALTAKIFNTLKGLGIKPKLGVTTDIKRLPGSKNSFNTDLSTLGEGNAESLKRLIANDADFLPQASADEIVQYNNNLEYLKSTYPDTFGKAQVVTESKTGIKTLVNDVDEKIKRPTKEDYEDYGEILNDSENTVVQGTETFDELEALVKKQKDYEDFMYTQYKTGKLDPVAGDNTKDRMDFLRKKAEEAEMTGDRRLFSINEMKELEDLEKTFSPMGTSNKINISDPKTAEDFTNFARQNDPEGFKKIQKITDDINNKNILENFDVKDREPNAKGGSVGNLTYKKMFGDLDKTLGKGLGTMFKKKRR
jgi:cell division protein ZapA (FtsZ GTPase activity inhibitor)